MIVLSLFLIFSDFEPRCSYKIVLIKKSVYSLDMILKESSGQAEQAFCESEL